MFGWLANLLIKAPIAGSGCACSEAKKEQLRQMQKAILAEDDTEMLPPESSCRNGCCGVHESRGSEFDMTVSTHYKL